MDDAQGSLLDEDGTAACFDVEAEAINRATGIARSFDGTPDAWKADAFDAVFWCANRYEEFTTDEVIARLEALNTIDGVNLMGLGHVMQRSAKEGWIFNTERTRQTKISRRHRKLTVWGSLLLS